MVHAWSRNLFIRFIMTPCLLKSKNNSDFVCQWSIHWAKDEPAGFQEYQFKIERKEKLMWSRPSPAVCCTMLYDLMIWPFCSSSSSFWVVVGWISQGHIPRSLLLQDWETNEPVEMKLQRMTEFQHLKWFLAFRGISKLSQRWYSSSIWLRWLLFKRSSHGSLHCRMMTADCSKNLEI